MICPDSEVLNKMCYGKTKGGNVDNKWVEPLQCGAHVFRFELNDHVFHSKVMCHKMATYTQKMIPLSLR